MNDPFLNYDLQMLPPDDEGSGWFECVGCGQSTRFAHHGDPHDNCPMTTGVVGYWVEIPNAPISAAEEEFVDSFDEYLD